MTINNLFENECRLSEAERHILEAIKFLKGCDNVSGLIDLAEELRDYIEDAKEFTNDNE